MRQSDFSRSESYQNFFYYPSTFFGTLLPFVLLSILNGFLIWTVRKSQKIRHTMTNSRQVCVCDILNTIFTTKQHSLILIVFVFWLSGLITREQDYNHIDRCCDSVFCLSNTKCATIAAYYSFELSFEQRFR